MYKLAQGTNSQIAQGWRAEIFLASSLQKVEKSGFSAAGHSCYTGGSDTHGEQPAPEGDGAKPAEPTQMVFHAIAYGMSGDEDKTSFSSASYEVFDLGAHLLAM